MGRTKIAEEMGPNFMEQLNKNKGGRGARAKRSIYIKSNPSDKTLVAVDEWRQRFMEGNMDTKI